MPSTLDLRMDVIAAKLTGVGGPMATGMIRQDGRMLPVITTAPPSLPDYFAHFCAQHGNAEFLVADGERLSFSEVHSRARAVAAALIAGHGIARGDHVAIAARNAPAWIILYMGILMAGGVATLLNGWWQGGELVNGIIDSGAKLIFADPPRAHRIVDADQRHHSEIVVIDMALPIDEALAPIFVNGNDEGVELPVMRGDDDATILFTSGSTGRSKGTISTHRAVVQATLNFLCQTLMALELLTEDGTAPKFRPATLLNVPLFHVTAEVPVFLQSFAMGRKLVLMGRWDAEEAMRLMEKEKITYFVGVPLMSFELLTHPNRQQYDLSSLADVAAGGAPRPVEHVRRLNEEMDGAKPLIGYGLTETNAIGCANFRENYLDKPNSTGRACPPLVDLAIVDEAGRPVPQGERGEICIRSIANFRAYWNDPEATAAAFTPDGYFRTGDIGYLDEDEYLFIVDRKKDIIIRGGENISCQEVEAAIYEHPAVAEVAVFGLTDERFGEVPGAVIVWRDGEEGSPDALQAFLTERLAAFKLPARIWVSPTPLPRLGTEKIDRLVLRGQYQALAVAANGA